MATTADVPGSTLTVVCILIGLTTGLQTYYLTDYCGRSLSYYDHGQQSIILELSSTGSYAPMTNCSVRGVASTGKRMMVKFLNISSSPNCGSYAYLYQYLDTGGFEATTNICTVLPSVVLTSGSAGYIGFYSDTGGADVYLRVLITMFWTGYCDEFRCDNDRCIDSGLKCSGYDNCGDDSNNVLDSCKPYNYILVISWSSAAVVLCVTFFVCVYRHKIKSRWTHLRSKPTCFDLLFERQKQPENRPVKIPSSHRPHPPRSGRDGSSFEPTGHVPFRPQHQPTSGRDGSSLEPAGYVPYRQPEVSTILPPLSTRRVSFTLPDDHDLVPVAVRHIAMEHELKTAVSLPDFADAVPPAYVPVPESPPPPYSDISKYATSRPLSGAERSTSPAPPSNVLYVSVVASEVAPEPLLPEHHNRSSHRSRRHRHSVSFLPSVDR